MVVKTEKHCKCKGCGTAITFYEYQGLEGRWYGQPHLCAQFMAFLDNPSNDAMDFFEEVPSEVKVD